MNTAAGTPCLYPDPHDDERRHDRRRRRPTYTDSFNPSLGTSFSAPLVSGTVALMLSARPDAHARRRLTQMLQATARPFPTTGCDPTIAHARRRNHDATGTSDRPARVLLHDDDVRRRHARRRRGGARRRSGRAVDRLQRAGPLVGVAGELGVRLGHQRRAPGRRHLRDLVHLRRERQGVVAVDDAEQGRRQHVLGNAATRRTGPRSAPCRSIRRSSRRRPSARRRSRSPSNDNGTFSYIVNGVSADEGDHARGVRRRAHVHVRAAPAARRRDQLPGPVVGGAGRLGIGLGHQPHDAEQRHLRDVVHLRRQRRTAVAFGHGQQYAARARTPAR